MKTGKRSKYPPPESSTSQLKEIAAIAPSSSGSMVRTQIYLSKEEYDFLQAEARRRDEPMAAIIRGFIDEKMEIPEDAWTNNPMLEPTVSDPDWEGREDGAVNHDHYLYGGPKNWIKQDGKWVETPPLPDDYFDNPASADAYDGKIAEMEQKERSREKRKAQG